MKILSKKTQEDVVHYIVSTAKEVRPSSFKGSFTEQDAAFKQYVDLVTDLVYRVGGMKGLSYLNKECGI